MIDVAGIVSQLMTIEQQPLQKLQTELSGLQTKISAWGRVQSALSTLQDASKALYQTDGWTASKAVSGDDATVTASGSSGASGSYSLTVEALARSQSVASRTFAASDTVVGGGTLTIQLGTGVNPPARFESEKSCGCWLLANPGRTRLTGPAGACSRPSMQSFGHCCGCC